MNLEETRDFFMKDRFATEAAQIEIESISDWNAKCKMVIKDFHRNGLGSVMGGAIFTLADFTFAVATNHNDQNTVTTTSTITYLAGTKGSELYAESILIKNGRTTVAYEINITDDLGKQIAVVMINGMKI